MAATCMMDLTDMTYDEEDHCQQSQSPNHLPHCPLGRQHTRKSELSLHKSLRLNLGDDSIIYEESKYRDSVTFNGDIFPLHFYQWRKKVLHLIRDKPAVDQGLSIVTFLEGEARSKLMSAPLPPTKEQVLGVLGTLYGDVRSIMGRLIFAHNSLGKIPSHGVTREHLLHLVNGHYRIIKGLSNLETEVMNEKSWKITLGNHQQLWENAS